MAVCLNVYAVFGGEVDCCEKHDNQLHYIELKTNREIDTYRQETNFKRYVFNFKVHFIEISKKDMFDSYQICQKDL